MELDPVHPALVVLVRELVVVVEHCVQESVVLQFDQPKVEALYESDLNTLMLLMVVPMV